MTMVGRYSNLPSEPAFQLRPKTLGGSSYRIECVSAFHAASSSGFHQTR